mgnify:CR=1 FL=1
MMNNQEQINKFITRQRVNLDIGFRCTLECPKCSRQKDFKNIRPVPGHDMTIDEFTKIVDFFPEVTMCGQISDPIFNPNFPEFVRMCAKRNTYLSVNTAASHKPMKWYDSVSDDFKKGDIIFGIDGLPKDSNKYRINQDGEKLFEVAKMFANKGITTKWQYIIFRYNENDIEEAKNMALDNGIIFELNRSSRWDKDDPYKPLNPDNWLDRDKINEI